MKILALDIGGTAIKYGIVDESGAITHRGERNIIAQSEKSVLSDVFSIIAERLDFDATAVCVGGIVDSKNGVILNPCGCVKLSPGMELSRLLEAKTGKKAYVENDVNSAALGEAWLGAGKLDGAVSSDFLMLNFGTSVGGALYIDGKLRTGASFGAGEVGHMTLHPGGKMCSCNRRGCYACYASTSALVESAFAYDSALASGRLVCERLETGDVVLKALVDAWASEVCCGIANVVHIMDVPLVILGGGIMESEKIFLSVNAKLHDFLIPSYKTMLKPAIMGNSAGLLGAARIAFDSIVQHTALFPGK